MASIRAKNKDCGNWDEPPSKNRQRAWRTEEKFDAKGRRQESHTSKNGINNHNKFRHVRERHDSSNSNPPPWKPNHTSVNDPLWDDSDQHFPALGEAPVPKVNVWEERKAKAERIKAIEPQNINDEEAMLQWALELSKREAAEEEEQRRKVEEQFRLQEEALRFNPEFLEDISAQDDIEVYPYPPENNTYFSDCVTKENALPCNTDPFSGSNAKRGRLYSNANNTDNKMNKIIECFGGWGLNDKCSETNKLSNFVDEVITDNVETTGQQCNPKTSKKPGRDMKPKNISSNEFKKREPPKPIPTNGLGNNFYDGKGTFSDPDDGKTTATDSQCTNNVENGAEAESHIVDNLNRKDTDIVDPSRCDFNTIKLNHEFQTEEPSSAGANNISDAIGVKSSYKCSSIQHSRNFKTQSLDKAECIWENYATGTKGSYECNSIQPSHDFNTQSVEKGEDIWGNNDATESSYECTIVQPSCDFETHSLDNSENTWKTNNAKDTKSSCLDDFNHAGVPKTTEHEILHSCTANGVNVPHHFDRHVFESSLPVRTETEFTNADNNLESVADSESPPIMPPKPAFKISPSDSEIIPDCDSVSGDANVGVLPNSDSVPNSPNEFPFIPPQFPFQPQFPLMNPLLMNMNVNMFTGLMNVNPMMSCAMDPMFMLRNPHFASQLLAMENCYKSFGMVTGGFPMQPLMMPNFIPSGVAGVAHGVDVQTTDINSLPNHQPPNQSKAWNTNQSQALNANQSQVLNANQNKALNANQNLALNVNQTQNMPPGLSDNFFQPHDTGKTEFEQEDWLDSFLSSDNSSVIPPPKPVASSTYALLPDSSANNPPSEAAFSAPTCSQNDTSSCHISPALQAYITKTEVTGWGDLDDDVEQTRSLKSEDSWSDNHFPAVSLKNSVKTVDSKKTVFRQPASQPQFRRFQRR